MTDFNTLMRKRHELTFNVASWVTQIEEYQFAFQAFQKITDKSDSARIHLDNFIAIVQKDYEEIEISESMRPRITALYGLKVILAIRDVENLISLGVIARHAIVFVANSIQGIIERFFQCVFSTDPTLMYDYLERKTDGLSNTSVDLKDIVQASSKEALINKLAARAALIATSGEFSDTIKNLLQVSRDSIDTALLNQVFELIEQRDQILINYASEVVDDKDFENSVTLAIRLIDELEHAADKLGVPVAYHEDSKESIKREEKK
jgi:hypothetical protein